MALTRPTLLLQILTAAEIAQQAAVTTISGRMIGTPQAGGIVRRPLGQNAFQFRACHIKDSRVSIIGNTNIRVSMTILQAGLTGVTLARIAHKEGLTLLTLLAHGIVVTLQTDVQALARLAVGMAIAQTLYAAVLAHIAKVALALIGTHTAAAHTALTADGQATVVLCPITGGTDTLVARRVCVQIDALLGDWITIVMTILAFILRRTLHVMPADNIGMGQSRIIAPAAVDDITCGARRMLLPMLQCALSTNAIAIKSLTGTPATMRMLQTTGALCVHVTWLRTTFQLTGLQYQAADTASTEQWLCTGRDASIQHSRPLAGGAAGHTVLSRQQAAAAVLVRVTGCRTLFHQTIGILLHQLSGNALHMPKLIACPMTLIAVQHAGLAAQLMTLWQRAQAKHSNTLLLEAPGTHVRAVHTSWNTTSTYATLVAPLADGRHLLVYGPRGKAGTAAGEA